MKVQKFEIADLVMINEELDLSKKHFKCNCQAIVMETNSNRTQYQLMFEDASQAAWYHESELVLIEENRSNLIRKWKKEKIERDEVYSNFDWIFNNGREVLEERHMASIKALAKDLGINNLWGAMGEGITYFANTSRVLRLAEPFLLKGDKKGWKEFVNSTVG